MDERVAGTPRVTLITPLNRGLKPGQGIAPFMLTATVTLITPLNRGLKHFGIKDALTAGNLLH